jgi:ABC-type phosphate transport system substrate-binding protein
MKKLNIQKKSIVAIALITLMAFSALAAVQGALLNPGQIVTRGSSTVYPVTVALSTPFTAFYPSITSVSAISGGSGDAFPGLFRESTPYADIGSMSRPPTVAEWTAAGHENAQLWAVGIDSIAIIVGTSNTWLKSDLTPAQIADIYTNNNYVNWNDLPGSYLAGTAPAQPIVRIIRDHTSGTFDCFVNFILKPQGYTDIVSGYQELDNNADVYNYMTTNPSRQYAIAFIGMGFLHLGGLNRLNIYNSDDGQYYAPTKENVMAGLYKPNRLLWQVTNGIPTTSTNDVAKSVLISYQRLPDPTNPAYMGNYEDSPHDNFIAQEGYINMLRADFTGGPVLDSNLNVFGAAQGLKPTQTQGFPDNNVTPADIFYFAYSFGQYSTSGVLNPYADMNADGAINPNDIFIFTANY